MLHTRVFAAIISLFCIPGLIQAGGAGSKGIEFFESKIRPVLSKHCYECHSAQAKKLKAGLLVDSKEGMLKGGDNGPVLVAGKAKDSLLVKVLDHTGDTKMPPKGKLSKDEIADFMKWIDMGAPDPRQGKIAAAKKEIDIEKGRTFWSFQPLHPVVPPTVKNTTWARTPIDRFILAKLEQKNLTPNQPIQRERLIRRAYYDLLGLPPTPAEIDAFVKDAAPDAYEKLIERLLKSEHVGERWGRHWLDVVRFAESGGYEFDGDRASAHHYRDFVVKAFNQDMPFDQFVRWQIAGDLLVPGDFLPISATGFLVAGPYPGQTTAKTLQLIRYNHLDDMLSTIGSSMLGLSLGCARCHEHKYDPIPQEDYYRLLANLGRTDSTTSPANPDFENFRKVKAPFDQAHAPLVKARTDFEQAELPKRLKAWQEANKAKTGPAWQILEAVDAKGKSELKRQPDGSLLATGKGETNEVYTLTFQTVQKKIKALRIEALADKSLPKNGPGHGPHGQFMLTELSLVATPLLAKDKSKPLPVTLRAVEATAADTPVTWTLDNDKKTGWTVGSLTAKDQAAVYEIDDDVGFEGGTVLTMTLKFENDQFAIGRPRVSIGTRAHPATLEGTVELQHASELRAFVSPQQGQLEAEQRAPAARWLRKFDATLDALHRAVEEHAKKEPKPTLINVFAASSNRGGDVHFLVRGEVDKKRELAKAGFMQVLMNHSERDEHWLGKTAAQKSPAVDPRVALANWLTDARDGAGHLLARVIVNRLWQHHMGRGIVGTPNDFGAQGDAPTHPELIDWLAVELVQGGWKLKPIHKLIMTSAVYMQAAEINPANQTADPQNHLWWRQPTRRLEAEVIRDSLLAVAGTLDPKMYGPGTLDGNNPRRSVYLTVKRSQMIPLLQMFDVPEAMQSIGERSVTTVPTQSLAFMNSAFVRQSAQKFAARIGPKSATEPLGQTIDTAYLTALSRRPTAAERQRMESFIKRQMESYGPTPQAREQALTDFCQVILCLNEFIYVD